MKDNFLILITLLSFNLIFTQKNKVDYKYEGSPYYPELKLDQNDSLNWPLKLDISIDVKDIKDLDYSKETFLINLIKNTYSEYDFIYVKDNDTIDLSHGNFVQLYTRENNPNNIYQGSLSSFHKNKYPYLFNKAQATKESQLLETPIDINWDFRDYPFDTQKLRILFTSTVDSSIIDLNENNFIKSSFDKLPNLKDGFKLQSITTEKEYYTNNSDIIQTGPNEFRPLVTETLVFNLNIDREGSWLFFKLFIGGIISYLISCLMFIVPMKEFESKITLAVGAIFGGVGNRYFVDSVIPGVQVLTKADIISNFILVMIFLNILIMILKNSDKNHLKFLQAPENSLAYSIYTFITVILMIIAW